MDDFDDNIFDEDDALDFIIYDDLEKQNNHHKNQRGGCLGVIAIFVLSIASLAAGTVFILPH